MLGAEHGLVALDVDVDVGGDGLGDGVDAVGSAGAVGGREDSGQVVVLREGEDLVRVGGDEHAVEQWAGAGSPVDPGEHGLAGDFAEDLTGQAGGAEPGGDDGEGAGPRRRRGGGCEVGQGGVSVGECIVTGWCVDFPAVFCNCLIPRGLAKLIFS